MAADFNVFKCRALPGMKWFGARSFYVLGSEGTEEVSEVFKNRKRGRHPEEKMLKDLREHFVSFKGRSMRVVVYQSCSPCRSCSDSYADFVKDAWNFGIKLELTLVFVALYKIQRPSHRSNPRLSWKDHDDNLQGLRQLRNLGVTLKSFDSEDWCKLSMYLQQRWTSLGLDDKIDNHCIAIARDLDYLLGGTATPTTRNAADRMSVGDRSDMFSIFWLSGLHNVTSRRGACCVFRCHGCSVSRLYRNSSQEQHAEHELLADLTEHWFSRNHLSCFRVTVFQNLSPCGDCCSLYQDFLRRAKVSRRPIHLTIVFASFYNIRRPSCFGCLNHPFVPAMHHDNNYQGLMSLKTEGVRLRSFTLSDWKELCNDMELPQDMLRFYTWIGRQRVDEIMRIDMSSLRLADEY